MNYSKRQHIVPRFYLDGFSDNGMVQVHDLENGKSYTSSVKNTAVHKDFYTISADELAPDAFEEWLSGIEGQAAAIIRRIEEGTWPLSVEDRDTLAYFMTLQQQRGRGARDLLERIQSASLGMMTAVRGYEDFAANLETLFPGQVSDEGKRQGFDSIANYKQGDETTVKADAHLHIESMNNTVSKVVHYLTGRQWVLVEFNQRSLITSDEPLGIAPLEGVLADLSPGLATSNSLIFALTRKIGLAMNFSPELVGAGLSAKDVREGQFDIRLPGNTLLEKGFNQLTCYSAFRQIYLHPDDTRYIPEPLKSRLRQGS